MSEVEILSPSGLEVQHLPLHKDPSHTPTVDGAHPPSNDTTTPTSAQMNGTAPSHVEMNGTTPSSNGVIDTTTPSTIGEALSSTANEEPVVQVAPPDNGTTDVNATLLAKPHDSDNTSHTTSTHETQQDTQPAPPTTQHEVKDQPHPAPIDLSDVVIQPQQEQPQQEQPQQEQPQQEQVQQQQTTTATTQQEINASPPASPRIKEGSLTKASSSNNLNNTTTAVHPQHIASMGTELRTSARNLRNSVLGIEEDEVDENGVKKKGKRKERSHSRIVLRHKKNLMGETIYKGHQSWVLMLNIQTGIRNAVGRGHSRSTITRPLILSPSNPLVAASQSKSPSSSSSNVPASGTPPAGSPASSTPATPKYPADILGPSSFDSLEEFYATPRAVNFPTGGSSQTIPHATGPFKFKDYCPHAFRFLRHRFGIDTADYMVSLCNTQKNGENALRELPTPGKSGSLFFFSHDMRFIIKTIPKSEAKLLRDLLPSYVDHIAGDENTLLPKFFGMHRVKPHRGRQVRFLVMGNVFQTYKTIHERYDLKGSTLGRQASEEEKKKDTVTFKDLDFRERHTKIQIGPQKRVALLEQLQRDTKFLAKLNIMDYSLLIGIHNYEKDDAFISDPPSPQSSHTLIPKMPSAMDNTDGFHSIFQSNDGGMRGIDEGGQPNGKFYYMGIIDILMLYSARKKIEHAYKSLRYGNRQEISSISPNEYATRFYEFIAAAIT